MLAWKRPRHHLHRHPLATLTLGLVSLITVIALFVPLSPDMPLSYLDDSWAFGINQGIHQGLWMGQDIVFTYGPYASIFTKSYHPSTDLMMVSGSAYLALSYWLMFVLLMKGAHYLWGSVFLLSLPTLLFSANHLTSFFLRDTLLFSFPLLLGLLTFKMAITGQTLTIKSKLAPFHMALLFAPLGLLPLIKGSIMMLCCAVIVLCAVLFMAHKEKLLAATCLATPVLSMFLFWIASGHPANVLPDYLSGMAPIVSGYSGAMSIEGDSDEVTLYLLAASVLLLTIAIKMEAAPVAKLFLFCLYFMFLFIAFKAGFVRHDGHALISGTSLLIAAILLALVASGQHTILPSVLLALFTWCYIDSAHLNTSTGRLLQNTTSTYSSMWYGINNRLGTPNGLRLEFDRAIDTLQKQASFPVLQGTTDIYSYNQALLVASGNTWSPRPIFQSYAAYTPVLAEKNRNHLLGTQAPDNIIFKVEPVDGRMASMEDGASWPVMMAHYRPTHMQNGFLFLQKKANIAGIGDFLALTKEKHKLGERVGLPDSEQALFAKIEVLPTFLGQMARILYKPSPLQISLELDNGQVKQFRFIAGMAEAGFVISPLIENTAGFGALFAQQSLLESEKVKAMTITALGGNVEFWQSQYTLAISQIQPPPLTPP